MKSENHQFPANGFLQTSKKSIIYLGIALVAFTNVALALNCQQLSGKEEISSASAQKSTENVAPISTEDHSRDRRSGKENEKPAIAESDVIAFDPYQKSIEEVIAEDNLITESTVVSASSTEKTWDESQVFDSIASLKVSTLSCEQIIKDVIIEDSKIIESPILSALKAKSFTIKTKKHSIL